MNADPRFTRRQSTRPLVKRTVADDNKSDGIAGDVGKFVNRRQTSTASQKENANPTVRAKASSSPLETLLALEGEVRQVGTASALEYFICNETRKLVAADQFVMFVPMARKDKWRVSCVSSVSRIDRNAPLVRRAEVFAGSITSDHQPHIFDRKHLKEFDLGFDCCLVVPLLAPNGVTLGRLALLRHSEFKDGEIVLVQRLAGAYGHALAFFDKSTRKAKAAGRLKLGLMAGGIIAALALLVPVPMSILAPAEIVARSPRIITAPMDGVVDSIEVEPNAAVAAGEVLVRFNDVSLAGRLDIAKRNLEVADARYRRVVQGAASSADMRRDMAVAKSELAVATAERDEAAAALERTVIVAPRDGIALLSSKDDWVGRPVSTGERIMEIGDPEDVEVRVDVGIGDSVVLHHEASARIFLHDDPLAPIDAVFASASYRAQETEQNTLAYRVIVRPQVDENSATNLRIGLRGTARISYGKVALGYYLFRRPISVMRQWLGL